MAYRRAREENISELYPLVGSDCHELQGVARSLHRIDERACNYEMSEQAEEREAKREARLEAKAAAIAKSHRLKVYRQGDPRGWPLYLYSTRRLNAYIKRLGRPADEVTRGIDCCYNSVGTAVCPH